MFLLPNQLNFPVSGMFSNCCKVCSKDVTAAETSLGDLLYMNPRSLVDCTHDGRVIKLQCICLFVLFIFHLRVNIMERSWVLCGM